MSKKKNKKKSKKSNSSRSNNSYIARPKIDIPKRINPVVNIEPRPLEKQIDIIDNFDVNNMRSSKNFSSIMSDYRYGINSSKSSDTNYVDMSSIMISNFVGYIEGFNYKTFTAIDQWFDRMISEYGEDEVANMLQRASEKGMTIEASTTYNAEATSRFINSLIENMDASRLTKDEAEEMWEAAEREFIDGVIE